MIRSDKGGKVSLVVIVAVVIVVAAIASSVILFAPLMAPPGLERVEVSPPAAILTVGESRTFNARAFDSSDNEVEAQISWSLTPAERGSLSVASGPVVTVAASESGSANLVATASLGGVSKEGFASITVENTPPIASFTVSPPEGDVTTIFTVDASSSSDAEEATETLEVRWDWEDDGTWDTLRSTAKIATRQYAEPGTYTIRLEVKDTGDLTTQATRQAVVENTPPAASFTVTPSSGDITTTFVVDASTSSDLEDPVTSLEVRWDWEADGAWDTLWSTTKAAAHQYTMPGTYTIRLEVRDTGGLTDQTARQATVGLGDTILVGTNTPFAPFEFRDEEGNLVGFTIDLVEEIGRRIGKTIVWSDYSDWDALLEAGEEGTVDMIASSMTITEARDVVYDFSVPYYTANQAVLVSQDSTFTCPDKNCTVQDVQGKTYAVQTGTTSHQWVRDNLNIDCSTTGPLFCFPDVTSVINIVKAQGVDMAIMDLPAAVSIAADPANEVQAVGKIFTNDRYGMAVQEGDPLGILRLIDPIIQNLIDEGFIRQLEQEWGVPSEIP